MAGISRVAVVAAAEALGAGEVNVAQARVIVESLDALPDDLGDDLLVKAEAYLVEQAGSFGPRELRHLGRGVLEHLAPEIADEAEHRHRARQRVSDCALRRPGAAAPQLRPRTGADGPRFWPGAVVMMLVATMTAALVTAGGRSAWFRRASLERLLLFAVTLYLLPPAANN